MPMIKSVRAAHHAESAVASNKRRRKPAVMVACPECGGPMRKHESIPACSPECKKARKARLQREWQLEQTRLAEQQTATGLILQSAINLWESNGAKTLRIV